jgi:hypothetical protein
VRKGIAFMVAWSKAYSVSVSVLSQTAKAHQVWWACGGLNWPGIQTSDRMVKRPAGSLWITCRA